MGERQTSYIDPITTVVLCSSLLLVGVCVGVGVVAHRPDGPPRPASLPHPTRRPAKPSSTVLLQTEQQAAPKAQTFTIYSPEPIDLKYGQVHHYLWTYWNTVVPTTQRGGDLSQALGHDYRLPADVVRQFTGKTMAISRYTFDFVRRSADGTETPIPLYELYDHHHFLELYSGAGNAATLGASFEYRGIDSAYQHPYRAVITAPQRFYAANHLINTKHPTLPNGGSSSPLTQCPCTPQRVFDLTTQPQTVDGEMYDGSCGPWIGPGCVNGYLPPLMPPSSGPR